MFILAPWVGVTGFIIAMIIIYTTQYVSLASVSCVILAPILTALYAYPKEYIFVGLFIAILGVYRHRSNIKRLLNGTENKINLRKGSFFKR